MLSLSQLSNASPQHEAVEVLLRNSWLWHCKKASLNRSLWPRWKRSWYPLRRVGPRAGPDPLENWKICCLCWESNSNCSAIQPVIITVLMCNSGSWMLTEYVLNCYRLKTEVHVHKDKADSILLYAVNTAISSVETANTTLHTRKIYNLLKSNKSKLILFNTSDSRYLYYVKYSHNLLTYSITIKTQRHSLL